MRMKNLLVQTKLKVHVIGRKEIDMIKNIYKQVINITHKLILKFYPEISFSGSSFYYLRVKVSKNNNISFKNTRSVKSFIEVNGLDNVINTENSLIESCQISIKGTNNELILKNGVKLRKTIINLRGSNCKIVIGGNTSFGQSRLVNVGKNNNLIIGEDCLFADNIEVWASDTHSIYDKDDNFINPEKPIVIGNKVWIGSHVKILKGVTIGDNAIIGMNSLVTKNVEGGTLCAANPLRVLKKNVRWSLKYETE